jgi:hypothetical protein
MSDTRYRFEDIDGNYIDIDNTIIPKMHYNFSNMQEKIQSDIKVIEKTFLDGGIFSGEIRLKSNEIEFTCELAYTTDSEFRAVFNIIMFWSRKTVLIKDLILGLEKVVRFSDSGIKYEDFLRSGKMTLSFKSLNPFWEKSIPNIETISTSSGSMSGTLSIVNNGLIPALSIITLNANELTTKILFHIPSTNQGIYIKDIQFGLTGLTQYVIDNTDGSIKLSGNRRNQMIDFGTGPFSFPAGTFDLDYIVNGDCDISISFKERYYI